MKVRWKEHEFIIVTISGILFLGIYLWRLFIQSAAQIELGYGAPFKLNQVPFSLFRNVLLPDLGLALLSYLAYLWLNLFAIPRLWYKSRRDQEDASRMWIKRSLGTLLLLALLVLVLGSATTLALYLKDEWRFHYPGFSFFFRGHNVHDNVNTGNAFMDAFICVAAYMAYAVLREVIVSHIGRVGEKKAYRIMIANQATGFLVIYIVFILFELVILGVPAASPVTRLYIALLFPVILVFLNIYWLFPADQKQTLFNRGLLTRLLLCSFICSIPVPFFFGFGMLIPIFMLTWTFQLTVITPISWLLYKQQKDKILAFRGLEKALVKSKTDLQSLRSQINPHFLFNTLNTLYSIALLEGSERTAEGIQKLGDMMRFMLHENNRDFISLEKEIEYLQNYIALQKLRLPEASQSRIELSIDENFPDQQIAPMLLIPLVENAFKHGVSLKETSPIRITFRVDGSLLHFEVINNIHSHSENDPESEKSGIGLNNVRERLNLVYANKHKLIAHQADDKFTVQLDIELKGNMKIKPMKKLFTLFVLFLSTQVLFAQDVPKKTDALVQAYVNVNKFNGSVLVAQKGKVLLAKGYGFKDAEKRIPNDANTIFQLGSITKEFTSAVILKLAEDKKLALSDKLSKYYPDFPKGDSITIKNLLTHTSGIFDYTHVPDFIKQSVVHTDEQKVLEFLKSRPLDFSPGTAYSYSNSGYMLLAYIIQKVTGSPYETVVRNMLFKPLHMSHTGFDFTGLNDPAKAKGYTDFSAAEMKEGPAIDSSQFIGSGEIYSTVGDLYKWHNALQTGKILSKALQEQAYQPNKGPYGYGWELDTAYHKQTVGHSGGMFGFRTKMVRVPVDDVFVILLCNDSDDPYINTISKKILAVIYGQPYILPAQPIKLTTEMLKAYAGTYIVEMHGQHHSFETQMINGHLMAVGPEETLELIPIKNNYFRFMGKEGEEGDLEFIKGDKGNVTEYHSLRPDGVQIVAKKVK